MVSKYPVIDVSDWPIALNEPRGTEEKTWLSEVSADGEDQQQRWLFKPVTSHDWAVQGEDWAEKVASEIGRLLGMPCAYVELATRGGIRGLISRDLAPWPLELYTCSILLSGFVSGYRPGASNVPGRPGHSLTNIRKALAGSGPPPGAGLPIEFGGFDVFAGYLVLDGLIANRDRHDENWAILRPPDPHHADMLCGSYDHASSLGFNLTDDKRGNTLKDQGVERWVRWGTAYRFEHHKSPGPPTLVQLAAEGLRMAGQATRDLWLDRLAAVSFEQMAEVIAKVPIMSDLARTFATEVLTLNKRRLLDEC